MSPVPALASTRAFAAKSLAAPMAEPSTLDALRALRDAESLLLPFPSRLGALMPVLACAREALRDDGLLVLSDLVWQTAPTPELIRAFAPPPGGEKIRPIEGYEMQIEHCGFEIVERIDLPKPEWLAGYQGAQHEALANDPRGAAKVVAWLLCGIE